MNKKGFVLIETLVVTMFTLFIFTILYNSVVPLLGRYKELSYYDDLDTTYDLYHINNLVKSDTNYQAIISSKYKKIDCNNDTLNNQDACYALFDFLEIDSTMDEVIYLNMSFKDDLLNDSNISDDVKNYLNYFDINDRVLLLQNDGYISYLYLTSEGDLLTRLNDSIHTSSCNPSITDTDGTVYLSGNNDCVNFNYIWYSGKLWRITSINPNGTMKIITDSPITAIAFGNNVNFYVNSTTNSYMYQWLNQDFLDTLYNYQDIIVTNSTWNTTDSNSASISTKLPTTSIIKANVGLLNSYEYYKSYQNTGGYSSGYLNIGYYWWLLNPYSLSTSPWVVSLNGVANTFSYKTIGESGVRPVIVLKSNVKLQDGDGSKSNPYRLKADKEDVTFNSTLLNTRSSGEYVSVNDELFRIVDIEIIDGKNTTKLIHVNYLEDSSGTILTKQFASSVLYGAPTNTKLDDYSDYYLNNTWLKDFDTTYNETDNTSTLLVKGTYYLGYSEIVYKKGICENGNNVITTKECTKTSNTWIGFVGLPRYGEMFSTNFENGSTSSDVSWLITPYTTSDVRNLRADLGGWNYGDPITDLKALRPTINVNANAKITSGDGQINNPYKIKI